MNQDVRTFSYLLSLKRLDVTYVVIPDIIYILYTYAGSACMSRASGQMDTRTASSCGQMLVSGERRWTADTMTSVVIMVSDQSNAAASGASSGHALVYKTEQGEGRPRQLTEVSVRGTKDHECVRERTTVVVARARVHAEGHPVGDP